MPAPRSAAHSRTHAFSVLVIAHRRNGHLANLVAGLNRSTLLPTELVVAYMDQADRPELESSVPVKSLSIAPVPGGLPLAAARNAAARAAGTDRLVFLDVDCIPAADMFEVLMRDLDAAGGLVMAHPRYLPPGTALSANDDDAYLLASSTPHRGRHGLAPAAGKPPSSTDRYELFWSLGFAVGAGEFDTVGGFDEAFTGYGGEDTDFAFSARRQGLALSSSSASMFHQHHGVHRPPIQHLVPIVRNCCVFLRKWGRWPMTGWLEAFRAAGYIRWSADSDSIHILRHPSREEIAATAVDAPY